MFWVIGVHFCGDCSCRKFGQDLRLKNNNGNWRLPSVSPARTDYCAAAAFWSFSSVRQLVPRPPFSSRALFFTPVCLYRCVIARWWQQWVRCFSFWICSVKLPNNLGTFFKRKSGIPRLTPPTEVIQFLGTVRSCGLDVVRALLLAIRSVAVPLETDMCSAPVHSIAATVTRTPYSRLALKLTMLPTMRCLLRLLMAFGGPLLSTRSRIRLLLERASL